MGLGTGSWDMEVAICISSTVSVNPILRERLVSLL